MRAAADQSCALLASALILGSLSPLRFRFGKLRILYVIPYIIPMIVYIMVAYGVFRGVMPHGPVSWLFPGLAAVSLAVAFRWDLEQGSLPIWLAVLATVVFGGFALWFCFGHSLAQPLVLAEAGNHVVAALLVLYVFRRLSLGVGISFLGLLAWASPILLSFPAIASNPDLCVNVIRLIILAKVATALGLILLTLENEVALNKANGERERRARQEMEAYTALVLSRRRLEDFDAQATEICRMVVENSRFSQAGLVLLQPSGVFRLTGAAGFDRATENALESLASQVPADGVLLPEFSRPAVPGSLTVHISLDRWPTAGDELRTLGFTSALVVPLQGREGLEGGFILGGIRQGTDLASLSKDDLLPLEMLAGRLQAVRSQTRMLEKLIDSEKFAGLGQLAGNVTQQLNNPLTVILGYASLLEGAAHLNEQERKGIEAILSEARQMRATLQSLSQVARSPGGPRAAISLQDLLPELEHLHRSEFMQRSIHFQLHVSPAIPRVLCHGQQLRQAVMHCLQFAMDAVEHQLPGSERTVRVDAIAGGPRVQIVVAHSGPAFQHPDRAFDPYVPSAGGLDLPGFGLSLCATILRENQGRASAVNLGKKGAAILLDLCAA